MKTLLTGKEVSANCKVVYNDDYTAFTIEGEPRGKSKQVKSSGWDKTSAILLEHALFALGLRDYVETCLDGTDLYIRIYEED